MDAHISLLQRLPKQSVIAAIRHAHWSAELLAATLSAMGFEKSAETWPSGFLLELAAVLRIGEWEHVGLDAHIAEGLPSFAVAAKELASRAIATPSEFNARSSPVLWKRVLAFYLRRMAWDGLNAFGADVVVGDVNENVVDQLARALWKHRH